MTTSTQTIVLVTPVWNDSARLEVFGALLAGALAKADLPIRWVVADDGSDSGERKRYVELVERFSQTYPKVELEQCARRSRKGGAIYDAWAQHPEAEWLAFVDADGAITPETMLALIRRAMDAPSARAVIGVRSPKGENAVRRKGLRQLSFRTFKGLVALFTSVRHSDTQCGAKVIPGRAFREASNRLFERGFVFDVELLLVLKLGGWEIEEVPIPWVEIPGSRLALSRDGFRMLWDLIRMGGRLRRGWYQPKA